MKSLWVVVCLTVFAASEVAAQPNNSWTKPTSGYWEEPNWSLGHLPAGEYVMFTNSGWKALAIGWSTIQANSASLWIEGVEMRADADSLNTLLLNYLGVGSPLRLKQSIYVGTNCAVQCLGSALEAGNYVLVDGTFTQADSSEVTCTNFGMGWYAAGSYNMNGGILRAIDMNFGVVMQSSNHFNQEGGVTSASNVTIHARSDLSIRSGARFDIAKELFSYGVVNQSGGSRLTAANTIMFGSHTLTNSVFVSSNMLIGDWRTGTVRAAFSNIGGSNYAAGHLHIQTGDYWLQGGNVLAYRLGAGGGGAGWFHQNAGEVRVSTRMVIGDDYSGLDQTRTGGLGVYTLDGGVLRTAELQLGTEVFRDVRCDGTFEHNSGTNYSDQLTVGMGVGVGTYKLVRGLLVTTNVSIWGSYAAFHQFGGVHSANHIGVDGYDARYGSVPALYDLTDGTLNARSIDVRRGKFDHLKGTNNVAGDLVLGAHNQIQTLYTLGDWGQLTTSNTILQSSVNGGFHQNGGTHRVAGLLDIHPPVLRPGAATDSRVRYHLLDGELIVRDIRLRGGIFWHSHGYIGHSGTLMMDGGTWEAAPGFQYLGKLQILSSAGSIVLPSQAITLSFAPSSSPPWATGETLFIDNWQGHTNGGGLHRVLFGTNAAGVTPTQVAQIRFRNPVDLQPGNYLARMLASGEVVPVPRPTIRFFRGGPEQLVMQWPLGYTLQTATNLNGPWVDVPGQPAPPYTYHITREPTRFFRMWHN